MTRLLHTEVLPVAAAATAAGCHDAVRDGARGAGSRSTGGSLAHLGQDGEKRRIWAFVMTLGWSPGLLRGTGTAGGYHRLRPVSRQRLRVPGRRAPGAASTTTPR